MKSASSMLEDNARTLAENILLYEQALQAAEPSGNNYHIEQIEILDTLALLYRKAGDIEKARDAVSRQYFISRVSRGLYDEGHIRLLAELADISVQLGEKDQANEYQYALLNLQTRILDADDPVLINAYLRWADWHLQNYISSTESILRFSNWDTAPAFNAHFKESDSFYRKAIASFQNGAALNQQTRMSLLVAIRKWQALHFIAFKQITTENPMRRHDPFPGAEEKPAFIAPTMHVANIAKEIKPPALVSQASDDNEIQTAIMQYMLLGDWQLSMGSVRDASESYGMARQLLQSRSLRPDLANSLLTPGLQISEPDDWYYFYSRRPEFRGHFDVTITLDVDNSVEKIDFENEKMARHKFARALKRHILLGKFRPLDMNGKSSTERSVSLRYYYE